MKRVIVLLFLFLLVLSPFSSPWAKGSGGNRVIVYYFLTNFRCPSCYKIERYTKEAVEHYFKDELTSGTLVFKPINIEEKKNQHFVKDYNLYTKSVVISLIKEGKEAKYDNLMKVWEYLGDKEKFYGYIKTETAKYLEEVK